MECLQNQKIKYEVNELTLNFFKKSIFNGEIFIIKKTEEIENIIKIVESHLSNVLDKTSKDFLNLQIINDNETDFLFKLLQNRVKLCNQIRKGFGAFLSKIGFKTNLTYMDLITLRFSPGKNTRSLGTLKPTEAHRDTWASNVMNQINFWFPIHNVSKLNSIYLATDYFKKKVENNSKHWSFNNYKKKKNYPSVPTTNHEISNREMKRFKISRGEVLCFSGHHLHGSLIGKKNRINLETRIVNRNDHDSFNLPINRDSKYKQIKNKWFKNLETGECY